MKIFLIRHGESVSNTGENFLLRLPDHKVHLTENGKAQADEAGQFLRDFLPAAGSAERFLWVSPYARTRETAAVINQRLLVRGLREDIRLVEQQYGLFDALPYETWGERYPNEFEHYQKSYDHGGKFWARFPMGESAFDVAIRVQDFINTLHREKFKFDIDTFFIVTHGATLRAFVMQWMGHPPEWFQEEENPKNCAIRFLEDDADRGYIY